MHSLFAQDKVYRNFNNAWLQATRAKLNAQSEGERNLAEAMESLARGLRDQRGEVLERRVRENLKRQQQSSSSQ